MTEDDEKKLATVHGDLAELVRRAARVVPIKVLEGHRGKEAQDRAFAEGKSKLQWPNGRHNSLPSLAVDLAPVYHDGAAKIDWNDLIAFGRVMGVMQCEAAQHNIKLRFGLDWDGDFRSVGRDPDESFLDAPHVEIVLKENA